MRYQKINKMLLFFILSSPVSLFSRQHRIGKFCSLFVQSRIAAQSAVICGDLIVKGKIIGEIDPGVQGPPGPQGAQGPQGPEGPPGPEQFGNIVRVDQVFGNDATGMRNGDPFLTINAALAAALPGDVCWIFPGTYAESFTIPDGVSVVGMSAGGVTTGGVRISIDTAASLDLVTMGENTTLENVTLSLTADSHLQLRGVLFPDTSTNNSKLINVNITVDNSSASIFGSSTVIGVQADGTGVVGEQFPNCIDSTIMVSSAGTGVKRGLFIDGSTSFNMRDSTVIVTSAGGAGSYIGAETNNPAAVATVRGSSVSGATADISQTQGVISLVATNLRNSNANSLGFQTGISPAKLFFGDPGGLPAGNSFLRPGMDAANSNEVFIRINQPTVVKSLGVRSRITPATTDTFTVRRNGINTALTVSLTNPAVSAVNNTVSVMFAAGDSISVMATRAGGGIQDPEVVMDLY